MTLTTLLIVLVGGMTHVLWLSLARHRFRAEGHANERLNYVNFGVGQSFGVACLIVALQEVGAEPQPWLNQLLFVVWTATTLLLLWLSKLPKIFKCVALVFVLGTPFIFFFCDGGVHEFLSKIDNLVPLTGDGGSEKAIKPSGLFRWTFFFINAFLVFFYYGRMYEINYREKVNRGEIKESLHEGAIERSVAALAIATAFFLAFLFVGTDVEALGLFSGLLAAGLSVAFKDLLANVGAGVLLLLDKTIKIDDVISLDEKRYGLVKSMTMRYLVLEDRNEIRYLIPNSEFISKTVTNWTHKREHRVRLKVEIGVAYDSDVEKVKEIMEGVCMRVNRVVADPPPRALVLGAGDSAINFQLRFFIADPKNGIRNVMSEVYTLLLESFKREHISVPFPQREIRILQDNSSGTRETQSTCESGA